MDEISNARKENDSLGEVDVLADKLRGAQTQRSLAHFSIGAVSMPREMIGSYAVLKKATAIWTEVAYSHGRWLPAAGSVRASSIAREWA